MENSEIIAKGRRCLSIEIEALQSTSEQLDERFAQVVLLVRDTIAKGNKLIFSGIGKSAHICEKLVGTFNSIGAPSCFIDPVRALHGDMGLCREGDTLLAFSNSGETSELLRFVSMVSRFDLQTVAVTSQKSSSLAEACDALLLYHIEREACPLDLAPTASTTAGLAIGDAVAMVLLEMQAFSKEDFARFHPGGSLGKTLAPRVEQIMRSAERLATLPETANCKQCLETMSRVSCGCIALTSPDGTLSGILTDGDIRRYILNHPGFLEKTAREVMTKNPITISAGAFAAQALKTFEKNSIDDLIVVDANKKPIGIIDGQDLTKLRMV